MTNLDFMLIGGFFDEHHVTEQIKHNHQKGGFTIPTEKLYPFQWMWDSGFIALGFAHFDIEKAKMKKQYKCSMGEWFIPHIVFHTKADTIFIFSISLVNFHQKNLKLCTNVFGFVLEKIYKL